jgi:single-strand DNA-binding protein
MNKINLVGRLTAPPVLKTINAGSDNEKSVCEFSIACERTGGRSDGRKPVDYFDIRVWFNADAHQKYLIQGQRINIAGEVRQERWTDKETGQNRSRHLIVANDTESLDKPRAARNEGAPDETDADTDHGDEEEPF